MSGHTTSRSMHELAKDCAFSAARHMLQKGPSWQLKDPEAFEQHLREEAQVMESSRFPVLRKGQHRCRTPCLTEILYCATLPENNFWRDDQHVNLFAIMNDAYKLSKLMAGFDFSADPYSAIEEYADILRSISRVVRRQPLELLRIPDDYFYHRLKIDHSQGVHRLAAKNKKFDEFLNSVVELLNVED